MHVYYSNSKRKIMQELIEEYVQSHGFLSERGPMINGGLDGLLKYLKNNGYTNPSIDEVYEYLKFQNNGKNYSTRG